MGTGASYQAWLNTPDGAHVASLDEFYSLRVARAVNDVGALDIVVPNAFPYAWLRPDMQIEVVRHPEGGAAGLLTDTVWLVRDWGQQRRDGALQYAISAASLSELLQRRIVYAAMGSAEADKTDYADDMMKAIVREQMGALVAESARGLTTYLSVAADVSRGPTMAKQFAYRNVLSCLQEIADASATQGTALYFDIYAASSAAWVFQTYIGQRGIDRTANGDRPLIISEESGNLVEPSLREDHTTEVTYVYAGGHGIGTARVIGTAPLSTSSEVARMRASPFARREAWVDARHGYTTVAGCQFEAESELRRMRPRRTFAARILDAPGAAYQRHWGWGDSLTVAFNGALIDCLVAAVDIEVSARGEQIGATLRSLT